MFEVRTKRSENPHILSSGDLSKLGSEDWGFESPPAAGRPLSPEEGTIDLTITPYDENEKDFLEAYEDRRIEFRAYFYTCSTGSDDHVLRASGIIEYANLVMKSIEKALMIIESNLEESDFSGPIEQQSILDSEQLLHVNFPNSYKEFLSRYGAGDIFGIEVYGIIKDPKIDPEMVPNGIWLTRNLRKDNSMPSTLVTIASSGYGPYFVIDCSVIDSNGECPIALWSANEKSERIFESFGDFLLDSLEKGQ